MSQRERVEEALFSKTMSDAGWDAQGVAEMLRAGASVHPEGHADFDNPDANLALQFFAAERACVLLISSAGTGATVRLRFEYGDNLHALLQWLVRNQQRINTESFAGLLGEALGFCDGVLLVDDAGTAYRLGLGGLG